MCFLCCVFDRSTSASLSCRDAFITLSVQLQTAPVVVCAAAFPCLCLLLQKPTNTHSHLTFVFSGKENIFLLFIIFCKQKHEEYTHVHLILHISSLPERDKTDKKDKSPTNKQNNTITALGSYSCHSP